MRNWTRTMLSMLAAAATALVFMVAPASAGGNTQISGVGTFDTSDQCTELDSVISPIVLTGDLEGCWYTTFLEVVQDTPSGVYQERGTETFIGCLSNGACGTFSTTYKFTGKFAVDGAELHGRCQHPIVSGADEFEGITGRVDFKDDIQTGEFPYRGHIKLP